MKPGRGIVCGRPVCAKYPAGGMPCGSPATVVAGLVNICGIAADAGNRGRKSIRKSYVSLSPTAACRSWRCSVFRLFLSVWCHARTVSSLIISSHAFPIRTGASPEIMNFELLALSAAACSPSSSVCLCRSRSSSCKISSSLFITFLIRASGRL